MNKFDNLKDAVGKVICEAPYVKILSEPKYEEKEKILGVVNGRWTAQFIVSAGHVWEVAYATEFVRLIAAGQTSTEGISENAKRVADLAVRGLSSTLEHAAFERVVTL